MGVPHILRASFHLHLTRCSLQLDEAVHIPEGPFLPHSVFESVVQHLILYPFHFSNFAGSEVDSTNCTPLFEIKGGSKIKAVTFTANGEYLVGGGEGLGVWRMEDGKQMATMAAAGVQCLAVSKDGRWIAAGTDLGEVFVENPGISYSDILILIPDSRTVYDLIFMLFILLTLSR